MSQYDVDGFLKLYQQYRYEDQLNFYISRQQEFTRAQTQALVFSTGLILLVTLAGALEVINVPWFRLLCLLVAAICPVLSTALIGYIALYAFEQQAKLYQDAIHNLHKMRAQMPSLQASLNKNDLAQQVSVYVSDVERILQKEQAQWGQLAKNMKPPEI